MSKWREERGAVAVEFAFVVPVLLLILFGIMEFGRAYNTQISLTHAARETARHMAVTGDWGNAIAFGRDAAPSLTAANMSFAADPAACAPGTSVNVTITYPMDTLTGVVGDWNLTGKAAMRCGG
ncbi:TadE/TadG family type IV pilus assembly protein [Kocuria sp. SM24M-10]|uniref:TadE/TadG family type IV pilus assembly protein n=1 Tax=Kocuria sp. SM24M-10 TaxID=1660349 RepID=UPI000649D9C5|nr:TadE family protein [Kocuria sp. SM24M-10]KLU11142.1 pilus assembly protein TadE [Kocuria sp. SM24M-10]